MGSKSCPRCGAAIKGYVDECPSCGLEKPVPLSWPIYGIMVVMLLLAIWVFIDLDAIARAILAAREATGSR